MSLDFIKKAADVLMDAFKESLKAFGTLAVVAFVIVVGYFGIDFAVYVFEKGLEAFESILALIPR